MPRKIVVAGGLAAGPAAASKAKRIDPSAEVLLIEKGRFISYGICELPFYISNTIYDYKDLLVYTPEKLKAEKDVDVLLSTELREIDHKNREILVFDSQQNKIDRIGYDKLILALGSIPKKLNELPDTANTFHFKSMDDAIKLKSYINYNSVKTAVIFGGGFIGLELAESLNKIGIKVLMFGKEDLPMSYFDIKAQEKISSLLTENNIEYIKYSSIDSCGIKEGIIDTLEIDGRTYKSDVIITAIGIEPNSFPASGSGIATGKRRGILVDRKMQTNVSGIYACGECCEFTNKLTAKHDYFPFANVAQKTGWVAGENAAGGMKALKGIIPAYGLKIFDTEFACVGLSYNRAVALGFDVERVITQGWTKPHFIMGAVKITVVLVYIKDSKILIGAEVFGSDGCAMRANILSAAIDAKMSLSDLSDLDLVYQPLLSSMRDPIHYAASAGLK